MEVVDKVCDGGDGGNGSGYQVEVVCVNRCRWWMEVYLVVLTMVGVG